MYVQNGTTGNVRKKQQLDLSVVSALISWTCISLFLIVNGSDIFEAAVSPCGFISYLGSSFELITGHLRLSLHSCTCAWIFCSVDEVSSLICRSLISFSGWNAAIYSQDCWYDEAGESLCLPGRADHSIPGMETIISVILQQRWLLCTVTIWRHFHELQGY